MKTATQKLWDIAVGGLTGFVLAGIIYVICGGFNLPTTIGLTSGLVGIGIFLAVRFPNCADYVITILTWPFRL